VLALLLTCLPFDNNQTLLYSLGFFIFVLTIILSTDLLMFYLSFEALSLLSYGLIAINKSVGSSEASIKYFVYGSIASVFLIFGLTLSTLNVNSIEIVDLYNYLLNTDSNSVS